MQLGLGFGFSDGRRRAGGGGSIVHVDSPVLPGTIIDDGGFEEPPVVTTVGGTLVIKGKKASGQSGKFIYSIGVAEAGTIYQMRYDPDFTLLQNQGKTAMVGFGLLRQNDFHLAGLKGNGGTGLRAYEVSGANKWQKTSGFTITDDGPADYGTQAGPNWLEYSVDQTGTQYTMATSPDGDTWTNEITNDTASPFPIITNVPRFGIAVFLDASDDGPFTIAIEIWRIGANPPIVGTLAATLADVAVTGTGTVTDAFDDFVGAMAYHNVDISGVGIPLDGSAGLIWNSEEIDTNSLHSTASNTERITIPAGLDGRVGFFTFNFNNVNNNGRYYVIVTRNNGTDGICMAAYSAPGDGENINGLSTTSPLVQLVSGDVWDARMFISNPSFSTRKASSSFSLTVVG